MKLETKLVHSGENNSSSGLKPVAEPIVLSTNFKFDFLGEEKEFQYSRVGNPNRSMLERKLAEIEFGVAAFAFSSGMAAISSVIQSLPANSMILSPRDLYGGSFHVFETYFRPLGYKFHYADNILAALEEQSRHGRKVSPPKADDSARRDLAEKIDLIFVESPTNPFLKIIDLKRLSILAHKIGAMVCVDNTFATPSLQNPILLGADIVVHSATKFLGGHSDITAGAVVVKSAEFGKRIGFVQKSLGAVLPPFDSFLLARSIQTLDVRVRRQSQNAKAIAEFLKRNKKIGEVYYPAFESEFKKTDQMKLPGAVVTIELKSYSQAKTFTKNLKLFKIAESLGGVESIVNHTWSMSHDVMPPKVKEEMGITKGTLRLSIGIEAEEDLIEDLEFALSKI
ncbi:MAG: PLP-dependent aspartate aminotransferase family protein [Bacteroidetes bacterium]|nr:PLP-dependent aspartate aminotransferase family protein [Bacteroidota bacterium]MCL5738908.1 PLP-dependent aspartate aminotransferase family protein [Bacteroidota bacterium]